MVKKLLGTVFTIWILIMIIYFVGSSYYQKNVIKHPFVTEKDSYTVIVSKGDTLNGIINFLSNEEKFNNALMVKYYIKNKKITADIKPGKYTFNNNISMEEFVKLLGTGNNENDPNIIKVTIPEGYDVEKIAQLLQDKGIISKEEFINSCKSYQIPQYVKNDNKRKYLLEGYLFPDTYDLKKGSSGKEIIAAMLGRFEYVMDDIRKKMTLSITSDQIDKIIIMASIVEREVAKPDERSLVTSVFYNRLKIGMKLGSDATVIYALGTHKEKLSNEDIKVNSPYNTYIVNALPQGPICCPGRASIEASLAPADTKYLYFKAGSDKTHFYTDYNEFLNARP